MAGSNHRRRHPSNYSKRRRRRRHHPYKRKGSLAQQKQQQQNQKKQEKTSGQFKMDSSEFDDDDIHMPVPVPMLDIRITSWLPLPEMSGAWRWCSYRVTQSLNWMKDTIFPSRVYWRELKETKEQLLHLHQQIEQLRAQTVKVENQHTGPTCACNCQNLAITERPHLTQQLAIDPMPVHEGAQSGASIPPTVSAAPPPPPPPPPPPIAQPPKLLVFKKKTSKSSGSADVTKQPPIITLSDIMNVKLKKVSCQVDADKQADDEPAESRAMTNIMNVQLKKTFKEKQAEGSSMKNCNEGFKAVRLKRRKSVNLRNDENSNPMVLRSRISEEAVQFRGNLRKVQGMRSPGRTPLRSKSRESHGTGLTPLITTALRRKFKTVRTPSPTTLAISSSTSPLFNF